ncbi:MAG: uracil-DNA glycosylase [Candidatus Portnoybacteria bacterium]|nr:uracil-DNA glycosylase [Candidatus Portnoybacteria bacterium]
MISETDNRTELLRKIKDEVVNLKESPLYQERVRNCVFPVIGEGSHYAKIMFIGEAPGKTEAETGRPFAGAAGKILDNLLHLIGIERKDVYVTNVVKDRPPQNRDPFPEEIALYAPFLDRQIEIIKPQVIVLLGRHSMRYIMEKFGLSTAMRSISQTHGSIFEADASYGLIKIIPLYHPAAALYNPELRSIMEKDFETVKKNIEAN